jgi:hypothetical protein
MLEMEFALGFVLVGGPNIIAENSKDVGCDAKIKVHVCGLLVGGAGIEPAPWG